MCSMLGTPLLKMKKTLHWEYFLSSPLWMNKTIKIENKPVFYEDWFRKGICFVNDIISEDGKFISIDQLEANLTFPKIL